MDGLNKNCAIIISSCDNYRDAWAPFFTLFFRYWPNCPFQVYLISNTLKYPDERVKTIDILPDQKWSGNMITALNKIPEKYIIYFQEDYFLRAKVDNEKIFLALKLAEENKAAGVRLFPCPGPDLPYQNDEEVGLVSQNALYRNSTQTTLWNKQKLLELMRPGETGWDFELRGGLERARAMTETFFAFRRPVIDYFCTAILKGKYLYDAVRFCRREGIRLDHSARKFENFWQYLIRKLALKTRIKKICRK
jgi:hypothetical protein